MLFHEKARGQNLCFGRAPVLFLFDKRLHAAHTAVFQHYLNSMWVGRALGQDALHNAFRLLSAALVLFLHNPHAQSRPDRASRWYAHFWFSLLPRLSLIEMGMPGKGSQEDALA
jgi:hypothetical protein